MFAVNWRNYGENHWTSSDPPTFETIDAVMEWIHTDMLTVQGVHTQDEIEAWSENEFDRSTLYFNGVHATGDEISFKVNRTER